jgi:RHS repeat-associated protein
MKRLLLLGFFSMLFHYSFTQIDVQRDNRVNPLLKKAVSQKSVYTTYGRSDSYRFINIAVLNQVSHTLTWFTCHGRLFDSTKLTDQEYEQVTTRQLNPFELYQHICNRYLAVIATVRDIYRVNGDKKVVDSSNAGYQALFAMESVRRAKTPLQKLIAIENIRKSMLTQLAYLNCGNPFSLQEDSLFKTLKEQAGAMVQTKDSTIYYNIDPTSAVTRIGLYKNAPEKLYIYNRLSQLIDSVPVLPAKYDLLLKEKTDVFLLYRGWLELQWQNTVSTIRRLAKSNDINGVGVFSQVNVGDEKAMENELHSQLHAIETKINLFIKPEAKSIEQAVYDTYKKETSEINYIPLLGIGYSLTQTRGQKEYELTNHLGNVLATVSDKKIGVPSASNGSLIDHYEPDIVSAQDYYPFGMLQPGRSYLSPNGSQYRYGFNDKENDNEVKGEGNQQDYGMRIYDPRIGRFLSIDPLTKKFPHYTPYSFSGNSPIWLIDKNGAEPDRNQAGTIDQAAKQWAQLKNQTVNDILFYIQNTPDAVRYVYTKDRGWIDLQHYFATFKYGKVPMDQLESASGKRTLQRNVFGAGANESYYSYEDLPSNEFASEIKPDISVYVSVGITEFDRGKELLTTIKKHFESAGATDPENAPNWKQIPFEDHGERRRIPEVKAFTKGVRFGVVGGNLITRTVNDEPVFYTDEEKKELLKSGKYVPQNHDSKPYDLNKFPAAPSSIEKGDTRKGVTGH